MKHFCDAVKVTFLLLPLPTSNHNSSAFHSAGSSTPNLIQVIASNLKLNENRNTAAENKDTLTIRMFAVVCSPTPELKANRRGLGSMHCMLICCRLFVSVNRLLDWSLWSASNSQQWSNLMELTAWVIAKPAYLSSTLILTGVGNHVGLQFILQHNCQHRGRMCTMQMYFYGSLSASGSANTLLFDLFCPRMFWLPKRSNFVTKIQPCKFQWAVDLSDKCSSYHNYSCKCWNPYLWIWMCLCKCSHFLFCARNQPFWGHFIFSKILLEKAGCWRMGDPRQGDTSYLYGCAHFYLRLSASLQQQITHT